MLPAWRLPSMLQDLAWEVLTSIGWHRKPYRMGPLGDSWNGREFELFLDAGIRFYQQAKLISDPALNVTTQTEVAGWLEGAIRQQCPGAVELLLSSLDDHWDFVFEKCGSETCFDDFHLCNGLMRDPPPKGERAVLIDIHPNRRPWILDPAHLQILNSGDRNRPGHRGLVHRMAVKRRDAGLRSLEGSELVTLRKSRWVGWLPVSGNLTWRIRNPITATHFTSSFPMSLKRECLLCMPDWQVGFNPSKRLLELYREGIQVSIGAFGRPDSSNTVRRSFARSVVLYFKRAIVSQQMGT